MRGVSRIYEALILHALESVNEGRGGGGGGKRRKKRLDYSVSRSPFDFSLRVQPVGLYA